MLAVLEVRRDLAARVSAASELVLCVRRLSRSAWLDAHNKSNQCGEERERGGCEARIRDRGRSRREGRRRSGDGS